MAYEFAQHVLDQLATATEIFAAGYVGINFVIYSWKRAESESSLTQPTVIPETTAVTEAPLEVLQPLPLSLPKRELVEISATTNIEAPPIRQLAELNEAARPAEPLPNVNLAPAPTTLAHDEFDDDLVATAIDELTSVSQTLTPEADSALPESAAIADTAEANIDQPQPVTEPTVTPTSPPLAQPPAETKPVLKKPPVRSINLGQSHVAKTPSQPSKPADKLTEED